MKSDCVYKRQSISEMIYVLKMKITTGLQCHFSLAFMCKLFLCLCLLQCILVINAKSLDHLDHHHSHHPTTDTSGSEANSCDSVAHYFNSLNVTIRPDIIGKTGKFGLTYVCRIKLKLVT